MNQYDTERSPEKWRPLFVYGKENSFDRTDLLSRFGERKFDFYKRDISLVAKIYDMVMEKRNRLKTLQISFTMPLAKIGEFYDNITKIYGDKRIFPLEDKISGFGLIFGVKYPDHKDATIAGITRQDFSGLKKRDYVIAPAFRLGSITLDSELDIIAKRRFSYIFGISPVKDEDIIEALKKINKFSDKSDSGRYIEYSLKERPINELKPTKGALVLYEEARKAKSLFHEVKTYELVGRETDPVVVGIDHFGNKMPLIYWADDQGLEKGAPASPNSLSQKNFSEENGTNEDDIPF